MEKKYVNELIEVLNPPDRSFKNSNELTFRNNGCLVCRSEWKDICGYRRRLVLITYQPIYYFEIGTSCNVCGVEAMLSLFLAIVTLIVSLFKYGLKEGSPSKQKQQKYPLV